MRDRAGTPCPRPPRLRARAGLASFPPSPRGLRPLPAACSGADERTFVAIKPDGIQRRLVGEIVRRFERKGLQLVGLKLLQVSGPARGALVPGGPAWGQAPAGPAAPGSRRPPVLCGPRWWCGQQIPAGQRAAGASLRLEGQVPLWAARLRPGSRRKLAGVAPPT